MQDFFTFEVSIQYARTLSTYAAVLSFGFCSSTALMKTCVSTLKSSGSVTTLIQIQFQWMLQLAQAKTCKTE